MSSSELAVSVRSLSKSYAIARNTQRHTTAAEALVSVFKQPPRAEVETFWALRDVNFDIATGDVVGIVGRNGAGKSTLLKILSRITEPTTGQIDVYGRIGSLLEVGTGFHPELTGRENVYLNGAILGMNRREIQKQFDAIVEFAGVEKFLDTPVKRYSSGMYVRLAFAVAAHLNPEILIVDEVLAVGDSAFQKKCLGKMQDVASEGRTVLFVSHSMTTVLQLCRNAIFLDQGRMRAYGPSADIVREYVTVENMKGAETVWNMDDAPGNAAVTLRAARVLDESGAVSAEHFLSQPIMLEMEFWCHQDGAHLNPSFHVNNMQGQCVFATINTSDVEWSRKPYPSGLFRARCVIPAHLLNDGQYTVSAFLMRDLSSVVAQAPDVLQLRVTDDAAHRADYTGSWIGVVRPMLPWSVEPVNADALERNLR